MKRFLENAEKAPKAPALLDIRGTYSYEGSAILRDMIRIEFTDPIIIHPVIRVAPSNDNPIVKG